MNSTFPKLAVHAAVLVPCALLPREGAWPRLPGAYPQIPHKGKSTLEAVSVTNGLLGNLASNRTPYELRNLFQAYGLVEALEIFTVPETRYSRGFAFVEMRNDLEATEAITHMNGRVLRGKPIQVQAYLPKPAAKNMFER